MTILDSRNLSSLSGLSNCIVNISNIFMLSGIVNLGANVTLNFLPGGRLRAERSVLIYGNHTKILASCMQIFEEGNSSPGSEDYVALISFAGSWEIPGSAFPQWWGVTTYERLPANNDSAYMSLTDASEAIQSAINLKGSGDVFLPRGIYVLSSAINLPPGINLIGEPGKLMKSNNEKVNFTMLLLHKDYDANIGGQQYLIGVNVEEYPDGTVTWPENQEYSIPFTTIKNIEIRNQALIEYSQRRRIPVAIYIGLGIRVENVAFYNFPCAVKSIQSEYLDSKQIVNCYHSFSSVFDNIYTIDDYAFDLAGLGDSLLFMHNHIVECKNALKLNSCGGGLVTDNIINGDIFVRNSKGIKISCNHMEYGAQIRVHSSVASIENNFIEKRRNPPFVIRGSKY